jgi:hypothetical protein
MSKKHTKSVNTLAEMGIFGFISERQLMVGIRQMRSENKNLFENIYFLQLLSCKSKFKGQHFSSYKKVLYFCKGEINSIY